MSAPLEVATLAPDAEQEPVLTLNLGGGFTSCVTTEIVDEWFLSLPVATRAEIYCAFFEIARDSTEEQIEDVLEGLRHPLDTVVRLAEEYARKHEAALDTPYTVPRFNPNEVAFLQRRPRCTER